MADTRQTIAALQAEIRRQLVPLQTSPDLAWFRTPEGQRSLARGEAVLRRFREARQLPPGDARRRLFDMLGNRTPRELYGALSALPKLGKAGRPKGSGKGSGKFASNLELLAEMAARVANGERKTSAARNVLAARGINAGLKNKADHLVKVFSNRGK